MAGVAHEHLDTILLARTHAWLSERQRMDGLQALGPLDPRPLLGDIASIRAIGGCVQQEQLFNFVLLRGGDADALGEGVAPLELPEATPLANTMARMTNVSRSELEKVVAAFASSEGSDPWSTLQHGPSTAQAVDSVIRRPALDGSTLGVSLSSAYGSSLSELVTSQAWTSDLARLGDMIVADYFLGRGRNRAEIAYRVMAGAMRLARQSTLSDADVRAILYRPIRARVLKTIREKLQQPLDPTPPAPRAELVVPEGAKIRGARLSRVLAEISSIPSARLEAPSVALTSPSETPRAPSSILGGTNPLAPPGQAPPGIRFSAPASQASLPVVGAGAMKSLTAFAKQTLSALGVEPTGKPLPLVLEELTTRRRNAVAEVRDQLELATPRSPRILRYFPGVHPWPFGEARPPARIEPLRPLTEGRVYERGIGDLIVVKQTLKGYVPAEIGHIENVLVGENKTREHRRRDLTEEQLIEETEVEEEEVRDLQTTTRFEITSEVKEVLREEFEVKGGVRVKASYGPSVEIEAEASAGYRSVREAAAQRASTFAREIVDKTVARVSERVKKTRSTRSLTEIEEINLHAIDNRERDQHVVGVYQWVDKVYEAQAYRYDRRLIYDFDVPEPGAYLHAMLARDLAAERGIEPPRAFTNLEGQPLGVDDINESDYAVYAEWFEAADSIAPPPSTTVVVSETFSFAGTSSEADQSGIAEAKRLAIPDGMEAYFAVVVSLHTSPQVIVTLGGGVYAFGRDSGVQTGRVGIGGDATPITGSVAIGVASPSTGLVLVTCHVACRPTAHALESWRVETFAALQQAHARMVAEYEEALAAQAVANGLTAHGPRLGLDAVQTELKKACVTLITAQHYDGFDAIEREASEHPQIDLRVVRDQGAYARFFEQAFEWENMNYVFYSYFWGRKSTWSSRIAFSHASAEIKELIKAGSARVVVAVRPGFREALRRFLDTGRIGNGDDFPDLEDEDYFDVADELRARTDALAGDPTPVGEPWTVRVPTSLVALRQRPGLPAWAPDDEGNWHPVDEA